MSDLDVMKEWLQEEYTIGIPKDVHNIVSGYLPKKWARVYAPPFALKA